MFDELKIQSQIAILRQRWLKEPSRRDIIERRGLALKRALEIHKNEPVDAYEFTKQSFK
jgi:hypothetical protein